MADKYAAKEAAEKAARQHAPSSKKPRGANPKAAPKPIVLIAGLGNPGAEYAQSRHNSGLQVVDLLAQRWGAGYWKQQLGSLACKATIEGAQVVLAKPQSYMNVCGGPVAKLLAQLKAAPEQLLVVHDMLDIPAGTVKYKLDGGLDGHNGLRSIAAKLKTRDFKRMQVGIGRPPGRMDPGVFVLKQLKGKDWQAQQDVVALAADEIERVLREQAAK